MKAACSRSAAAIPLTLVLIVALSGAQQDQSGSGDSPDTLSSTPQIFGTSAQRFRVVPLKGFLRPTALAFLPSGDMLVTELGGRLRIVHDFALAGVTLSASPGTLASRYSVSLPSRGDAFLTKSSVRFFAIFAPWSHRGHKFRKCYGAP